MRRFEAGASKDEVATIAHSLLEYCSQDNLVNDINSGMVSKGLHWEFLVSRRAFEASRRKSESRMISETN